MRIDVACGGTGGHMFPGVVTARCLRGRGHAVTLWLAAREDAGEMHADVVAFLDRRNAWAKKPKTGRTYCR